MTPRKRAKVFWFFFSKKNAFFLFLLFLVCPAGAAPRYTALLVAGDDSLPVFDNAVSNFRGQMIQHGLATPDSIRILSASGPALATPDRIVAAIRALRPAPGEGCLIYATSHGEKRKGLYLAAGDTVLTPAALDAALRRGCGRAPTVVIISACFSGQFARGPMRRANRVILTAARPDRTSFGCEAGRQYTVYDRCLLDSFPLSRSWRGLFSDIRACVAQEERRENAYPSEPQAYFGSGVESALPAAAN